MSNRPLFRTGNLRRAVRPALVVLAALMLSGCIIEPGPYYRPYHHPYYWYR